MNPAATYMDAVAHRVGLDRDEIEPTLDDDVRNALAVFVLNPRLRGLLEVLDPQALQQARRALGLTVPTRMVRQVAITDEVLQELAEAQIAMRDAQFAKGVETDHAERLAAARHTVSEILDAAGDVGFKAEE